MKMLLARSEPHEVVGGFSEAEIKFHFDHITRQLGECIFILGDKFSAADFGITYVCSMAKRLGVLENYPALDAYLERNRARPAFRRAIERAVE